MKILTLYTSIVRGAITLWPVGRLARRPSVLLIAATTLGMMCSSAQAAGGCAGSAFCTETSTFIATLTNFRTSATHGGANRTLTATINLQNKTDRPLTLGYVEGTGVALDEHGNRYTISRASDVRGIGEIQRRTFDPKFTLQPGERSDSRFDLHWHAGKSIVGVRFDLELAIREIDEVTGNQHRLGREHALQFAGLADGVGLGAAAIASTAAPATSPAPVAASAPIAAADPCAGVPRCHAAGPFVAEITQLSASQVSNNHLVRVAFKLRNLTNQPLILAYQTNSGTMLDNYGNRYTVDWRYNDRVKGIGVTSRQKADPQFVLSPGESRSISLEYARYVGKSAIGTVFSPDLVFEQLEILPSQQVRSVRDYNVSFANVTASTFSAAGAGDAVESINEAGRALTEGLKSLFKRD